MVEARKEILKKEFPDTLTSISNLASMLQSQGKYEAVKEMDRRTLQGRKKVLGKRHLFYADKRQQPGVGAIQSAKVQNDER